MNSLTYNIPAELVSAYSGRQVIVRSHDPAEIVGQLSEAELENVQYVQLLSANVEPDALELLANWGADVPLDIVIGDPAVDFPLLYNFSKLLDKHPIRASIAVKPGFFKAVKLALALHFAVKLDVGQPDPALIEELAKVLELYLHSTNVAQPVEYFHSIFLSLYREEPASLWMVQEDDPDHFRFVSDDGTETFSRRFGGLDPQSVAGNSPEVNSETRVRGGLECDTCEFMASCGGYFKWPDGNYDCRGVKTIFAMINAAAAELRSNIAAIKAIQEGANNEESSAGDLSADKQMQR